MFHVVLLGCDREELGDQGRQFERVDNTLVTVTYQCRNKYMTTLAQKVAEHTNNPFDAPPSGGVTWNPSPKLLLQELGFSASEDFVFFFNYPDSTFVLRADQAGHSAFLALHEKLDIPLKRLAEQD